jgi:hypothetical protein
MDRFVIDHAPKATAFDSCPYEWLRQQHAIQLAAIDVAETLQYNYNTKRANRPDRPRNDIPVGALVLLDEGNRNTGPGPTDKLSTPKRGPYMVLAINEDEYHIRHLSSNAELRCHINRLVNFICPQGMTPEQVAHRDCQVFPVAKIISANVKSKRKADWKIKVAYEGTTDVGHLTWSDVKDLKVFHDYLRTRHLQQHIPRHFTSTSPTADEMVTSTSSHATPLLPEEPEEAGPTTTATGSPTADTAPSPPRKRRRRRTNFSRLEESD